MRSRLIPFSLCFATALAACSAPVKPATPPPATVKTVPMRVPAPSPAQGTTVAAPVVVPAVEAPIPVLAADRRALFVAETAKAYGLDPKEIEAGLAQAVYKQSIINAITRPAESKPWKDYRPIFLTEARIRGGRQFLAQHRDELMKVQAETGVPAEMIVAIIGVETQYGGNTGSYRVLDALYTLGFFYPKREEFFRSELGQFFALAKQERLDIGGLKGSYAGAMGWGQFMPSSYRNYAKDGDGDGRRDLFNSPRDIFASIANYFIGYGWRKGEPVAVPAKADPGAAPWVPENYEAKYTLDEIAARGYRPLDNGAPALPATLLNYEGPAGPEYWIGYQNFYVITRYNRSPMYALAVYQLSREIAADPVASP